MNMRSLTVSVPARWMVVLPRLAEVGLVLILAWITAGVMTSGSSPQLPPGVDAPGKVEREAVVDMAEILKAAPFGAAAAQPKPVARAPTVSTAPSKLSIKLHGTVVAGSKSAAMLVSRPGAAIEVYYAGDTILPGVSLSLIEANRIVVETASGLEEIWMEEVSGRPVSVPQTVRPARSGRGGNGGNRTTEQNVSRDMLEGELNDLGKLMTQVRVAPYFENGQSMGFQVLNIVPGSIFERIGLQDGDVIQSINGQSLTDPQQAIAMYEQLQDASTLNVVLLRDNQMQTIQYQIQ